MGHQISDKAKEEEDIKKFFRGKFIKNFHLQHTFSSGYRFRLRQCNTVLFSLYILYVVFEHLLSSLNALGIYFPSSALDENAFSGGFVR